MLLGIAAAMLGQCHPEPDRLRARRRPASPPENSPENPPYTTIPRRCRRPPAAGVVAFLVLLLFGTLALLALRNLFIIVFMGRICHKSSGCASWASRPWDIGWETVGTVMSLFFSVMICWGCIQAIGRVSDGE